MEERMEVEELGRIAVLRDYPEYVGDRLPGNHELVFNFLLE